MAVEQRRPAVLGGLVHVRARVEQDLRRLDVAFAGREHQRRQAAAAAADQAGDDDVLIRICRSRRRARGRRLARGRAATAGSRRRPCPWEWAALRPLELELFVEGPSGRRCASRRRWRRLNRVRRSLPRAM